MLSLITTFLINFLGWIKHYFFPKKYKYTNIPKDVKKSYIKVTKKENAEQIYYLSFKKETRRFISNSSQFLKVFLNNLIVFCFFVFF